MRNNEKLMYYTNKKVRAKIDKLLKQNARNVANVNTGSKYDIGESNVVKEWANISNQIKDIDLQFYEVIAKQDDKQTVNDSK
jgi:hypothetical protein